MTALFVAAFGFVPEVVRVTIINGERSGFMASSGNAEIPDMIACIDTDYVREATYFMLGEQSAHETNLYGNCPFRVLTRWVERAVRKDESASSLDRNQVSSDIRYADALAHVTKVYGDYLHIAHNLLLNGVGVDELPAALGGLAP